MKFELSTQPFADALNLGVIPGNISKYFRMSCLAQLTASKNELRLNLQASGICTEITFKGRGDSEEVKTGFVDCLILKQLVGTFDTNTVTIEYTDGGIILHSGSSKFTLPYLAESEDGELLRPSSNIEGTTKIKLKNEDWKFIKDYQMYSVALSFAKPVYMNVWVSEDGDAIAGDFDKSMFTFSKKSQLGRTCLLADTIINLFNSLPEGAEIVPLEKSYIVEVTTDGFKYVSEFTPKYESDEGVDSYMADIILAAVVKTEDNCFKVPVANIIKFLNQSDILSTGSNNKINFELSNGNLHIVDNNINCVIKVEGNCKDFKVPLNADLFKPLMSHIDGDKVSICPAFEEGTDIVSGLVVWTENITAIVGAIEDAE